MGFLPPLVHQDVEGYEEVFEVHAAPPSVWGVVEAAMESERAAARLRPPVHGWPLSASFWRTACAGSARLGGGLHDSIRCTARHRTLAGCRDVLPKTPSS